VTPLIWSDFRDVRARRPVGYFVDKQNIIDRVLRGLAVFPDAAIVVMVAAHSLLGDGLRDLLDPRVISR
jgi:hypothetical protein